MGKKRKVNPHRIPISRAEVNPEAIMREVSIGNLYYAWLLIIPELMKLPNYEKQDIVFFSDAVDDYLVSSQTKDAKYEAELRKAVQVVGAPAPHLDVDFACIRSLGALETVKSKLRENALYSAMCLICLGITATNRVEAEQIKQIFLNACITLDEIRSGLISYADLSRQLSSAGIVVLDSGDDEISLSVSQSQ